VVVSGTGAEMVVCQASQRGWAVIGEHLLPG
jgi:hypothetical protein